MADATLRTWPALDLDLRPGVSLPDGFDDRLALALDDVSPVAVEERSGVHWRVYFEAERARDAAAGLLRDALAAWLDINAVSVPDEGWGVKVQQDLGAVRVGRFVVAPPWDRPAPPASGDAPLVIEIEPSMGFGTGHHQSTRLCLAGLQSIDLAGRRVIDAGTGSGVLAIAAAMLGASDVLALDNDPDAVAAARDNVGRNGAGATVRCEVADLGAFETAAAPVVVANLTAFLLRRYASTIETLVAPGGQLVTSGFIAEQVPLVLDAFPGFTLLQREDEDDWVALRLGRP